MTKSDKKWQPKVSKSDNQKWQQVTESQISSDFCHLLSLSQKWQRAGPLMHLLPLSLQILLAAPGKRRSWSQKVLEPFQKVKGVIERLTRNLIEWLGALMCFKSASDLGAFDVLQSVVFYWLFGLVPSNLVRQISIGVFQKKTVVSPSLQNACPTVF